MSCSSTWAANGTARTATDTPTKCPAAKAISPSAAIRTADHPEHVPIGLLDGARLTRPVPSDGMITLDDVELVESRAVEIWRTIR
ncbi:MAG TPA: hypothetical protein PLI31_05955 [Methanoregulaceae archaeon]|nr:hypothetical protein [Methanoregulaceae archaeon]